MHASGEPVSTIAVTLGVSRATVYRVLAEENEALRGFRVKPADRFHPSWGLRHGACALALSKSSERLAMAQAPKFAYPLSFGPRKKPTKASPCFLVLLSVSARMKVPRDEGLMFDRHVPHKYDSPTTWASPVD